MTGEKFLSLLKDTGAYRIVTGDKREGMLSHAYLFVNHDGASSLEYLKIFAKIILCKDGDPCDRCRICSLIDKGGFADAVFYPAEPGKAVTVDDVTDLIGQSYVKPLEGEKKLFVINYGESMSAAVQNKLLKTLEEPPKNVHILIGATSEFPLLPTVKSRVKKIEIPPFSQKKLFEALSAECPDGEKLSAAIAAGDGTVGKALSLYSDGGLKEANELVTDILINMKSSKDVLSYSVKFSSLKTDLSLTLSCFELLLRDMLMESFGKGALVRQVKEAEKLKSASGFSAGAIIYALEKVCEAEKRKKFNANGTMLIEWLLFQILEGKYKWQKL